MVRLPLGPWPEAQRSTPAAAQNAPTVTTGADRRMRQARKALAPEQILHCVHVQERVGAKCLPPIDLPTYYRLTTNR